jgi:hypothetical protein
MPPWWSGDRSPRDVGNLGARARLVQTTAAGKKLDTAEDGVTVREAKHAKLTTKRKTKTPDAPPEPEASDAEIFDYFMKVGAEFKGQLQSCYDLRGKGVEGNISIDPGQIMLPGATCSVSVSAKATSSKAMLLTMTAHPRQDNDKPMSFATLLGAFRTLDVSVAAEVGFAAPQVLPDIPDGLAEIASWELEAKATARAEAKYSGEYMQVSDPTPRFYKQDEVRTLLKRDFAQVRSGETSKARAKQAACAFCNQNRQYFGEASYDSFFGGHVGSGKLIAQLERGVMAIYAKALRDRRQPSSSESGIIAVAYAHISDLQPFLESFPFREYCSLRIWGHRGEASAGISAEASFKAKMEIGGAQQIGEGMTGVELGDDTEMETSLDEQISAGVSVGGSAKATLVQVGGSIKKTIYRYQSLTYLNGPARDSKRQLVMTQDTTITYKQALLDALKLEVGVEASAHLGDRGVEGGVGAELQPAWANQKYNAMSYVSGVAYWFSEGDNPVLHDVGSGYSLGQSCSLSNILALGAYNSSGELTLKTDPATAAYCQALGRRLGVTGEQVKGFLQGGGLSMCEALSFDPNLQPDAVLIEASFSARPALKWRKTLRGANTKQIDDFRGAMIEAAKATRARSLEAIRLRYRIADSANRDETKFKLGFKLLGNGAGIALSSVDRAGSEGVVDLATVWFNELARFNTVKSRNDADWLPVTEAYERAVPPVALLSQ